MSTKNEPTVEEAQAIVDEHNEAVNPSGLRQDTDPSSGVVMKAQEPDKSILTYDPTDVEYDEDVRKEAEKARKEADKAKKA